MNRVKQIVTGKAFRTVVIYCILLVAVMVIFDRRLQVEYYTVDSDKMGNTVRLVLLTDFHSNSYGKNSNKLVRRIDDISPDVVLLGGDIYDDGLPQENATALVEALAKRYPCFYVTGNHEYWSEKVDEIKMVLTNAGVTVLEGDCKTIRINGQSINICGADDPVYSYDRTYEQLKSASMASNNGYFTVLLSHRPELVDEYSKYNFDLVLAGHAHGGQIRIPHLLNGLYAPNQGWFPKYAGGKYDMGDYTMIVSRGLDRETIKIPRMFNRPEIVVVDVK